MAEGFRCRDATTAAVLVTLDTHLTKVLGFFNTGTADGSFADGNLANGTPFIATLPSDGSSGLVLPTVSINAQGVIWSWANNPAASMRRAVDVTYGFFT